MTESAHGAAAARQVEEETSGMSALDRVRYTTNAIETARAVTLAAARVRREALLELDAELGRGGPAKIAAYIERNRAYVNVLLNEARRLKKAEEEEQA